MSEYADRAPWDLEPHYSKHVNAMTKEGLHSKADIAAELAFRDARIAELEAELSQVRAELDGHRDGRMQAEAMRDAAEAECEAAELRLRAAIESSDRCAERVAGLKADRDSLQRECEGLRKEVERWKQQPNPGHPRGCICVRCEDARAAEPQEPEPEGETVYGCPDCDGTGEGKTYSMSYSDIPLCRTCEGSGKAPETERQEAEGRQSEGEGR